MGVKVSDQNSDLKWYERVKHSNMGISVFIPGHNLATGITLGAQGSYSNVSCLNPQAAQKWYNLTQNNMNQALELEKRIKYFMTLLIDPFITQQHFPNHACDRFIAMVGGWADVESMLRWPYKSIPEDLVEPVRKKAKKLFRNFLKNE